MVIKSMRCLDHTTIFFSLRSCLLDLKNKKHIMWLKGRIVINIRERV